MRRTYRRKKYKPDKTQFRANERIRFPEVQVIDENGKMLGAMPTTKAIQLAKDAGLDLVEVDPKASPPICKFVDYGKIQYEKEKIKQKAKAKLKKVETKGVRLSFKISDHDRDVRVRAALKFLGKGNKVKVELVLRGRENAYTSTAIEKANAFINDLKEQVEGELIVEKYPKKEGGRITAIVAVKKS